MTTTIDTVVIGAGAAGLTAAERLQARRVPFLVVDAHERIGDTWRERYRSLRLFTPRGLTRLRGMRVPVGFFGYPTGAQYADALEACAARLGVPVRLATRVTALTRTSDGGFRLVLDTGDDILARAVIVAAGAYRVPVTPPFADRLDPATARLHSVDYRGPEQLAPGPVLVVGAANSGTDIALEAAAAGHAVTLAGRHPGQLGGDIDTPIGNLVARVMLHRLLRRTLDTDTGRLMRERGRGHGVNLVRNALKDLDRAGIARVGRIVGIDAAGRPLTADGTAVDAATVVWCTGARPDLSWIGIPETFDEQGQPRHRRGVCAEVPGLAYLGLPFQYSPLSSALPGMQRDVGFVIDALVARSGAHTAMLTAASAS